jgi:hypothetical protein
VPDPIKAMEIMSQLNMEGGKEPSAKARSTANDKDKNPEVAEKFRSDLEKAKSDRAKAELSKMAEEHRAKAKAESPRTYTERLQDMGRLPSGGGGAMPKSNRDITKNYKAGGKVSSASKRADGCCIRGKTKA